MFSVAFANTFVLTNSDPISNFKFTNYKICFNDKEE